MCVGMHPDWVIAFAEAGTLSSAEALVPNLSFSPIDFHKDDRNLMSLRNYTFLPDFIKIDQQFRKLWGRGWRKINRPRVVIQGKKKKGRK